jgi:hypothetical protein
MEPVTRSALRRWLTPFVIVFGCVSSIAAEEPLEYQVKAAFLLNFTKFVEWPETVFTSPEAPIAICILGNDPFGATLSQIVAGETANGRKVTVERIKRAPSPKSCQVLFAGGSEKDVPKLFPTLGSGVLTVGEGESFVHGGGMIAFVIESRRVRFEINQAAAENAGLKLSARLLNVAKAVEK